MSLEEAEARFQFQLTDPKHADVAAHLWTLRRYAAASRSVVEIGTDDGSTTLAFILGRPDWVQSWDLWRQPEIDQIEQWAKELGVAYRWNQGDSRQISIPPCEMCFLDTDHVSNTLLQELERHSPQVSKYLFLHDTVACGEYECNPQDYNGPWVPPGLWVGAIGPFLRSEQGQTWQLGWVMHQHPGLTLLIRR